MHIAHGRMKEAFKPLPSFDPSFSIDSDVWPAKVVTASIVYSIRIEKGEREEKRTRERIMMIAQTYNSKASRLGGGKICELDDGVGSTHLCCHDVSTREGHEGREQQRTENNKKEKKTGEKLKNKQRREEDKIIKRTYL